MDTVIQSPKQLRFFKKEAVILTDKIHSYIYPRDGDRLIKTACSGIKNIDRKIE